MSELYDVLLGIILGYISISTTESVSHNILLHANSKRVKNWCKYGSIGKYLFKSWYSHHVVHHFKTFRTNHVTMFDSNLQRIYLESMLIRDGREYIISDSFGLRIGDIRRKVQYIYTHIFQIIIISYFTGIWGAMGILSVVILYLFSAEIIHPYLHLPLKTGIKTSGPLMKLVLNSNYFRWLIQYHYIHHKYINCNFNLLLGGDLLLGDYRKPNSADILEMKKLEIYIGD